MHVLIRDSLDVSISAIAADVYTQPVIEPRAFRRIKAKLSEMRNKDKKKDREEQETTEGEPSGTTVDADGTPPRASLGSEEELQAMGLKPGTPEREAFDKFIKYFDENAADKTDQPWVFYTRIGDESSEKLSKFIDDYAGGKFRLPGEPADGKLRNFSDDFDYDGMEALLGKGPAPNEKLWYDAVLSFACARLASTRGGPVRIIIPKGENILPINKSWTDFEVYELTKPDSKVTELWRYNPDNLDEPPELAWSRERGDQPLGIPPDFSKEMKWDPTPPRQT
jgi:hypothetical protein